MKNKIIGICPNCGANVVEREKGWFCENRECRFVLWKDNAFFKRLGKRLDAHVADKLLRDGRIRLKDCRSAKGKTYNATVLMTTEVDGRSKFSLEFEGGFCNAKMAFVSTKMESVEQVADAEGMLSEVSSAADSMIYRLDVCFEHYPEFLKNPKIRQKVVGLLQKAKDYIVKLEGEFAYD